MSKYDHLKSRLEKTIPSPTALIKTVSASEILVAEYEKEGTAYILSNVDKINKTCLIGQHAETLDETKVFCILNSPTIDFIPIDGKKGLRGNTSNCDFVFYNEHHFCFVELKLNATSREERAVRKNREKAIEQLTNTVNHFDDLFGKDYSGLTLEAYVATPDIYPRENATWQTVKTKFLEDNGFDLFESRTKRYK